MLPRKLSQQSFHNFVDFPHVHISSAFADVADDALGIEHIESGVSADLPVGGDRSANFSIPPTAPGDVLLFHHGVERLLVFIAVDSKQRKGFVSQALHERPLVGIQVPAGCSPVAPEIENHYFATVIRKLEPLAVEVFALDLWRRFAQRQIANGKQLQLCGLSQCRAVICGHIGK